MSASVGRPSTGAPRRARAARALLTGPASRPPPPRPVTVKVKEDDVVDFENEYRGSDEELRDLLELYERFRGDMKQLFDWMICSRPVRRARPRASIVVRCAPGAHLWGGARPRARGPIESAGGETCVPRCPSSPFSV